MKDLDRLLRRLRREGYTVAMARSGHWHVRDKQGRLVAVTSATPSDRRGLKNFKGDLRRRAGGVK